MAHLLCSGLVPLLWGFYLENKLFISGSRINHPTSRGFSVLWFPACLLEGGSATLSPLVHSAELGASGVLKMQKNGWIQVQTFLLKSDFQRVLFSKASPWVGVCLSHPWAWLPCLLCIHRTCCFLSVPRQCCQFSFIRKWWIFPFSLTSLNPACIGSSVSLEVKQNTLSDLRLLKIWLRKRVIFSLGWIEWKQGQDWDPAHDFPTPLPY